MARNHFDNILISRITFQCTLEVRAIATGGLLFTLTMSIDVQQEVFRIVDTGDATFALGIIAG